MKRKNAADTSFSRDDPVMVEWNARYATGIPLIDDQHKELVRLTNQLYEACLTGDDNAEEVFKEAMSEMVDYVHFHFAAEEKLLERVKFPVMICHKKQHETLIKEILEAAKNYKEGKKYVPNNFARLLKDWILTHIAVSDQAYMTYIMDLKKRGLLTDRQIQEGEVRRELAPPVAGPPGPRTGPR
jgi:hemerythrin